MAHAATAAPTLRADFLLCGRFEPVQRPLLKCPVHVIGGKADRATAEQLIGWSQETRGSFSVDMLAGGHFFIHEQEAKVLRLAEYDPLLDEGLAWAEKLRTAGQPLVLEVKAGMTHDFARMGEMVQEVPGMLVQLAAQISESLA